MDFLRRPCHLVLALMTAVAGPAFAAGPAGADARVAAAFGNTVTTTYPDGRSQKIWLRADGTWSGLESQPSADRRKLDLEGRKSVPATAAAANPAVQLLHRISG